MGIIGFVKSLRHKAYIALFRGLPLEKNKIIMWSDDLKHYGCSPKALTEYICRNYPLRYDIVWAFNENVPIPEELPSEVRVVRFFSLDFLRELHTAGTIVCNARMSPSLMFKKRKGQFYIQTWHSSLRLKKIEGDAPGLPEKYVKAAKRDSENTDLLLSGCRFSTECFRRAFWYKGEIFESGTPRCDLFFGGNSGLCEKVRAEFGLASSAKICLYAPTFRKGYGENDLGLDFAGLKKSLENRFGGEWFVLLRYHPNVRLQNNENPLPDFIKNATKYNDMQRLVAACDMLITDYSSCMFDAAIAKKTCLLFTPDIDRYTSEERGLYFDIKSLPFPKAKSNEELFDEISHLSENDCAVARFLEETGSFEDGNACERVCRRIAERAEARN